MGPVKFWKPGEACGGAGMEPRRGPAALRAAGNGALPAVVRGVGDRAPSCLAVVRGAANAGGAAPLGSLGSLERLQ